MHSRLNIRSLMASILVVLGLVAIVVAAFFNQRFFSVAQHSLAESTAEIVEITSHNAIDDVRSIAQRFARDLQSSKPLRRATKKPGKADLTAILDENFRQSYVTTGLLDVGKIRLYDSRLNYLGASSRGDSRVGRSLTPLLLQRLNNRKGNDRLKMLGMLWSDQHDLYYSVVVPIGGLRVVGYAEIITLPAGEIAKSVEKLNIPLSIDLTSDRNLFKTQSWDTLKTGASMSVVSRLLLDENNQPIIKLSAIQDTGDFQTALHQAELEGFMLFFTIMLLVVIVVLWILGRKLFRPLKEIEHAMQQCANGNLVHELNANGLAETYRIGMMLNGLIRNLNSHVYAVSESAELVTDAAERIAAITVQSEANAQQQREESEQTATAANQMATNASIVVENTTQAEGSTVQAMHSTRLGEQMVEETTVVIQQLADQIESATDSVNALEKDAAAIDTILEVIQGIAEQTNLLALNAAIEAARAGERGRGFAVVADEVRNLAQSTQQATGKIQEMTVRLQEGTRNAVSLMESSRQKAQVSVDKVNAATSALVDITSEVTQIVELNSQIALASLEQSTVAGSINNNASQVNILARETEMSLQEMVLASDNLRTSAGQLNDVVGFFQIRKRDVA